ncbi:MAG: hypothetical protein KDK89_02185 [Alphaproteobacteria bacterium]|nr:hypothetical protein [Alphaproteobacteria bacterium]
MKRRSTYAMLALALGAAVMAGPVMAKEQLLGTAIYEALPQRDVVNVGAAEGRFKAIRLEVRQNDVEVLDLKVVYGNGTAEDIRVRQVFKAGSSSRMIDLKGSDRFIKQIVVVYRAKGPARILFHGVEAEIARNWEVLGCKSVGFAIDRDVIKVGRNEGRFRALKLRVREAPVEFLDVRVVFGDGKRQDIRVRQVIRAGQETRPIDLIGESRGIDRVELLYRSIPTFKGKAEVCVDGLQR